jgi:hypothetical protein
MWLMEQPLPIVFVGVIVVVGLVAGLLRTGRAALLYAAIVAAVLTGALLIAERFVVTPREEVAATLNVIAHDIQTNNVEAVARHISSARKALRDEAKSRMRLVRIHDVDIKRNLKIEIATRAGGDVAEARFNAVIRFSDAQGLVENQVYPRFFTVIFGRESDGAWRIRSYTMADPRQGI